MAKRTALKNYHVYIILVACTLLLYGRTFGFEYTYYDDVTLIEDNKAWLNNVYHLPQIFSTTVFRTDAAHDNFYRPLLNVSFFLDTQLGGGIMYRITNVLLHGWCCVMLFRLLLLLNIGFETSAALSFLFCLHPLNVAAVAWLPGRNDTLLGVFLLHSFYNFVQYCRGHELRRLLFSAIAFFAALLTKESALFFIPVYIMFHFFSKTKKTGLFYFVIAMLTIIYFVIRASVIAKDHSLSVTKIAMAAINNVSAMLIYTGKMILPFNLSTYPVIHDTSLVYGTVALLLTGVALFFLYRKSQATPLVYIGWTICMLLPSLVPGTDIYEMGLLEHRGYVANIGFFIFAACALPLCAQWARFKWYAFTLVASCYIYLTVMHSGDYKNEKSFYACAIRTSPSSSFAHKGMGIYYQAQNNFADSEREYTTAIKLNPGITEVRNNLARLYMNENKILEAVQLLEEELRLNPESYTACYNIACIYMMRNDMVKAEKWYKTSLHYNADYTDALNDYGALLARGGRVEEARKMFEKILLIDPAYPQAKENIRLLNDVNKAE